MNCFSTSPKSRLPHPENIGERRIWIYHEHPFLYSGWDNLPIKKKRQRNLLIRVACMNLWFIDITFQHRPYITSGLVGWPSVFLFSVFFLLLCAPQCAYSVLDIYHAWRLRAFFHAWYGCGGNVSFLLCVSFLLVDPSSQQNKKTLLHSGILENDNLR